MMRMAERKTTIFCSCHLFVRGWAVLLHKLGTSLGKDEVAGSNPAISSIYGTPKEIRCSFFIVIAGYRNNVTRLRLRAINRYSVASLLTNPAISSKNKGLHSLICTPKVGQTFGGAYFYGKKRK